MTPLRGRFSRRTRASAPTATISSARAVSLREPAALHPAHPPCGGAVPDGPLAPDGPLVAPGEPLVAGVIPGATQSLPGLQVPAQVPAPQGPVGIS